MQLKKAPSIAGLVRSLSSRKARILSRYHRYTWISLVRTRRALYGLVIKMDKAGRDHYARISLHDLFVEDYSIPEIVKIPLKWDSGAAEVVKLPREAQKFTIKVFNGWKLEKEPQQWPWGDGKP